MTWRIGTTTLTARSWTGRIRPALGAWDGERRQGRGFTWGLASVRLSSASSPSSLSLLPCGGALPSLSSSAPSPFSSPMPSTQPQTDVSCRRFERSTNSRLSAPLPARLDSPAAGLPDPKVRTHLTPCCHSSVLFPSNPSPPYHRSNQPSQAMPRGHIFSVPLLNSISPLNSPMARSPFASPILARVIYRLVDHLGRSTSFGSVKHNAPHRSGCTHPPLYC